MNKFLLMTLAVLTLSVPTFAQSNVSSEQTAKVRPADLDWPFVITYTDMPWNPVIVHFPGNSQYF